MVEPINEKSPEKRGFDLRKDFDFTSHGAGRARTDNPRVANAVLSQLSYGPDGGEEYTAKRFVLLCPVDHECCRIAKELAQGLFGHRGELGFDKRLLHELHPAIACGLIDRERGMAHAEPGMAALLGVAIGSAEALDEKFSKPCFGSGHVFPGIHRAEDVVVGHLPIERADETAKTVFADEGVNLRVEEVGHGTSGREAFATPVAVRLPREQNAVVQPARPALPEFDRMRDDSKPAPMLRTRHDNAGEFSREFVIQAFEFGT